MKNLFILMICLMAIRSNAEINLQNYNCYQGGKKEMKTFIQIEEDLENIYVADIYSTVSNFPIVLNNIAYDSYTKLATRVGEGGQQYHHLMIFRDKADGLESYEGVYTTIYCK